MTNLPIVYVAVRQNSEVKNMVSVQILCLFLLHNFLRCSSLENETKPIDITGDTFSIVKNVFDFGEISFGDQN